MDNKTKTVYAYDADGKYTQTLILDHTDRSQISGAWQIPAQCTEVEPIASKAGFDRVYQAGAWSYIEVPKSDEPTPDSEPQQPVAQEHEYVDPSVLDLSEAVLELSAEIEKLKGDAKQ